MSTTDKNFVDQDLVNNGRKVNGSEHDCAEAGCTLSTAGAPITALNKAKRSALPQNVLDAIARLQAAKAMI